MSCQAVTSPQSSFLIPQRLEHPRATLDVSAPACEREAEDGAHDPSLNPAAECDNYVTPG